MKFKLWFESCFCWVLFSFFFLFLTVSSLPHGQAWGMRLYSAGAIGAPGDGRRESYVWQFDDLYEGSLKENYEELYMLLFTICQFWAWFVDRTVHYVCTSSYRTNDPLINARALLPQSHWPQSRVRHAKYCWGLTLKLRSDSDFRLIASKPS